MATRQTTIDYLVEQLAPLDGIAARKMFGEYALYFDGRVVALVCDDQLFIKPTKAGRDHIGHIVEAPPYTGAKPFFLIDGDQWEERDWLGQLVRVTAAELPLPKPKPKPKALPEPKPKTRGKK